MTPVKPIERAFIRVFGDPAAGLPDRDFEMTLHVDCADWDDFALHVLRARIADVYEMAHGKRPRVLFDFELG